jgi:hypothetical protein
MVGLADLSPRTYFGIPEPHGLVAVGWLGGATTHPVGDVFAPFLERLAELTANPGRPPFACTGAHSCELCHPGVVSTPRFAGRSSSSESVDDLFVPHEGRVYVAPEGVGHYVACHRHLPPVSSMEFERPLLACGGGVLLETPTR